jgi:hypothetical protein
MASAPRPRAPFYCPVCEQAIEFIYVWQEPLSTRIRMFCEDCSHLDEYRRLPKEQRVIFSREGFDRFAGRRLLLHVLERERAKRAADVTQPRE